MKIDSGLKPLFPMMVDITDSDVLLENPEQPLQLPSISNNISQGDSLHLGVGAEVDHDVSLVDEGHHESGNLQRRDIDSVSLILDIVFPAKSPELRAVKKDCQASKKASIGREGTIHDPGHISVGGKPAYHEHAQLLHQGNVFWRDIGSIDSQGATSQIGVTHQQKSIQAGEDLAQPCILIQRASATTNRPRWNDSNGKNHHVLTITNDAKHHLDIDSGNNTLLGATVEQSSPTACISACGSGEVIGAQGDGMPAFEGRIAGVPSPKMSCQLFPATLNQTPQPSRWSCPICAKERNKACSCSSHPSVPLQDKCIPKSTGRQETDRQNNPKILNPP